MDSKQPPEANSPAEAPPELSKAKLRILVVEDVEAMRSIVTKLLRDCGYERIYAVGKGEEAVEHLKQVEFDLVICDRHLRSTFSGLEILEFIRTDPALAKTPFIMMTVDTSRASVMQSILAGCDDLLIKPLSVEVLNERIATVLDKYRQGAKTDG